jgi:hypothetical protein
MLSKMHLQGGAKMTERIEESGLEVEAVREERLRMVSWYGEAVLLGQYCLKIGLVGIWKEKCEWSEGEWGCHVTR